MQKHERTGKRLLALVLALVMALSTVTECLAAVVERPVNAGGKETVTAGELVAKAYADKLTDAEKALLESGLLTGETYAYTAPASQDELVTVDETALTITAKSFTKDGFTWLPEGARIVVDSTTNESVELKQNGQDYVGSFSEAGNTYSVEVDYAAVISVSTDAQKLLLDTPYMLAKGLENIETLNSQSGASDLLEQYFDALYKLRTDGIDFGTAHIDVVGDAADAIDDMKAQIDRNGGNLDISVALNKYAAYGEGKTAYLVKEGTAIKTVAEQYYQDIVALSDTEFGSLHWAATTIIGLGSATAEQKENARTVKAGLEYLGRVGESIRPVIEDAWLVLNQTVVNSSLSEAQYLSLNDLAFAAMNGQSKQHDSDISVEESVCKLTSVITADVNQYKVTVQVVAKVIPLDQYDNKTPVEVRSTATELTLKKDTTLAQVEKAIADEGFESAALAAEDWKDYAVAEGTYYKREVEQTVGSVLSADASYTIVYTVQDAIGIDVGDGNELLVPYGYNVTLPLHGGSDYVYDYTVNGVSYDEGDVYRVVGNTVISRVEGKAWEEHNLGKLLYENYAKNDTYAGDILTNTALNTGVKRLRTPSSESGLLYVENNVVTAATYGVGGGSGLMWLPKTATPVAAGAEGTPVPFALDEATGKYTAVVAGSFDRVLVQYELTLDWDNLGYTAEEATEILNLPYTLTVAAKQQLEAMDDLAGQYGQLAKVNDKLSMINTQIVNDTEHNISAEAVAAWKDVYGNNVINKQLIIFPYIGEYAALTDGAEKLTYYYKNAAVIRREMDALCSKLVDVVLEDAGVQALVKEADEGIFNDLQKIKTKLREVNGKLCDVDGSVNIANPSLQSLAGKVVAAIGKTTQYATVTKEPVLSTTLSVEAPGKIAANITVEIRNSVGGTVGSDRQSVSFEKDEGKDTHRLTQSDIAELEKALNAALKAAGSGVDLTMYQQQENTGTLPQAGDDYAGGSITVVYEPKKVSVTIEGAATEFYVDDPEIELPPCGEDGFRYDYTVDGKTVSPDKNNKYRFSAEQVQRLLSGETITITRSKVDVRREAVLETVDALNAAVAKRGLIYTEDGKTCLSLAFIPVEKNGAMTILVRISPDTTTFTAANLKNLLADVANELMTYSEVKLSGGVLWDDELVYLQALIDTLLDSGFGMDTVLGIVDENGGVKENSGLRTEDVVGVTTVSGKSYIQVNGYYVPVSDDTMGGVLLSTDSDGLVLDGKELGLCVTLEDFDKSADTLKKMRDNLAKARDNVNAWLDNGTVNVDVTAPDKAYKAFLTGLLVLGETSVDEIANFDLTSVETLAADKIKPVLENEAITGTTIQNTLTKLGITTDVSRYTELYDKYIGTIRTVLKAATLSGKSGDATAFGADVSYPVKGENGITSLMGDNLKTVLENAIAEDALSGKLAVTLDGRTPAGDYAAIVAGSGGISFLTDLNTTIENNTSLVVLLKDCGGTLRINGKYVYVDLRGHTFSGDIIGTEQYKVNNFVVDSILNTNGGGTVTGKVQNMVLAGGSYNESKLTGCEIRNGYTMENGLVSNQYYTIAVNGSNINVTLKATAQSLRDADKYTVAALAGDLASDLLLNYYSTAQKVTVDGHTLYNAAIEDITTLFQNGKFHVSNAVGNDLLDDVLGYTGEGAADNYDGINYLIGSLLDTLLDFQNLADSIGSSNAAVSYSLATTAWDVTVDKAESGDYLAIGVTGSTDSGKTKRQTLNVFLNSDSEKNNEQLKNALEQLAGIIEVDTADEPSLSLDRITLPQELGGKTVQAKLSGSGHVTVKISDKPVYAALMAITVANSLPAGDSLRAELKNAVETFYDNNDAAALKTAMEKVTCAQVFAALKTVGLRTNFLQMAISVGFGTNSKAYKAISESYDSLTAYRGGMAAAGWLLKQLNINGNGATLAGFQTEFGIYEYAPDKTFNKTATVSGDWKVNGVVSLENAKLTLELFAEEGAIVVIDKDGKHTSFAADQLTAAVAKVNEAGGTLRFNDAVTMAADETITKDVVVVNGSKLNQGSYVFLLDGVDSKLTSDAALTVKSADGAFRLVTDNTTAGKYIYTLEAYKVRYVKDGNAAYDDSLAVAVTNADADTTITVLEDVTARGEIEVSKSLTIAGAGKITGDPTFKLTGAAGTVLTADAALTVISGDETAYYVNAVSNGAEYTYTLTAWEVVLEKADGGKTGYHDLAAAMADAVDGDTITVNSSVKMTGDISINSAKTLTIKGAGLIDQNGYAFILGDKDAKLVADFSSLTVKTTVAGDYELNKVTQNGMTTYKLAAWEIMLVKADGSKTGYHDLAAAMADAVTGDTIVVSSSVHVSGEIEVSASLTITGADKITGDPTFKLTGAAGTALTADAALTVKSGDETAYYINATSDGTKHTYTLTAWEVVLTKANGSKTGYHDLVAAMADTATGDTIVVNSSMHISGEIGVSVSLTITGADKIIGDPTFKLTGAAGTALTADAALTVKSGDETAYYINAASDGTKHTYTLTAWEITLEKADGSKVGYHDLAAAAADAGTDDTIVVNSSVKMAGDISINSAKTLTIKGAGLIDQNGHAFNLGHKDAKLVADSSNLTVKITVAGSYELSKVTQNGMTTYSLTVPTVWEITLEKADGSKVGYHDLAAAAADAKTGDTVIVNSSVKMADDIDINNARTLTIKGAGLIDQNGHAFSLGNKDAKLVADSSNLTVKITVAGSYELSKVTQNGMTTYSLTVPTVWEITLEKADGSKVGYHNLAAAAADAKTGDTVIVNSSVKMTGDISINSAKTLTIKGAGLIDQNGHAFNLGHKDAKLVADSSNLTVKITVAGSYELSKVTQNGMTTYSLTVPTVWEITLEKADGSKVGYHDLAAAAADAETGDTVIVNSSVKMTSNISISSAKTLTIKGAGLIDQNGHAFELGHKSARLVADSDSLFVKVTVAGSYEVGKVSQGEMTAYIVKAKSSDDDDDHGGGGGGGGGYTGNYIYLDVQPSGINAKQLQTAVRKYFGDSSAEVTVNSGLTASGLVANGASIYVSGSRAGSYTVIIMGDTNCNGKTDSGDAVKMRNHYFGTAQLSGAALEAADMNRNGKVDSGDAVKNRVKYQNWGGYSSTLKITV